MKNFVKLTAAASIGLITATAIVGSANAECDDPYHSCFEKLNDAAQDLKASNSLSDAWNNAKAAGNAARECVSCGLDNVRSAASQIKPNNSK